MKNKVTIICLCLFIISLTGKVFAQETMFQDLSYPYMEKLVDAAKRNYPQVKVLNDQIDVATSTYHQSHFTWFDAFTASYIYSPESAINATAPVIFKGYQLVATISLGTLFEKPYTIHNDKIAVKIAEEQRDQYMLTLEAQVKQYYFAYLEAQADLRNKVNAVQDAKTAVNQLKHTFEKGETSFQIYNEALTNLYYQNSFRLQEELAVFTAKTNLEQLLGAKLESIK